MTHLLADEIAKAELFCSTTPTPGGEKTCTDGELYIDSPDVQASQIDQESLISFANQMLFHYFNM